MHLHMAFLRSSAAQWLCGMYANQDVGYASKGQWKIQDSEIVQYILHVAGDGSRKLFPITIKYWCGSVATTFIAPL